MCVRGWKIERFNPAQIPVITREMDHQPEFLDLRGGPRTAGLIDDSKMLIIDHVDILGRAELNVLDLGSYFANPIGIGPQDRQWEQRY